MKKQFFTTAIAFIAALSLSASAFADASDAPGLSDIGLSGPGASTSEVKPLTSTPVEVGATAKLDGGTTEIVVNAKVSASDFSNAEGVEKVAVSVDAKKATDDQVDGVQDTLAALYRYNKADQFNVNAVLEIVFIGIKADDSAVKLEVQSGKTVTVEFTNVGETNVVFDPKKGEKYPFKRVSKVNESLSSFKATHFSPYYLVKATNPLMAVLFPDTEEPTTTTPSTPGGNGGNGGFTDGGNNGGNNSGNSNNDTTTTTTASTPSDNNNNSNNNNNNGSNNDTTQAPTDNGNNNGGNVPGSDVSEGGNNSNTGNTGDGAGNDKNQATGVVLAVVPAAAAAVAVIISKKRK